MVLDPTQIIPPPSASDASDLAETFDVTIALDPSARAADDAGGIGFDDEGSLTAGHESSDAADRTVTADEGVAAVTAANVAGEERSDLGFTIYHGQPVAQADDGPATLDALDPDQVEHAAQAGASIAIGGAVTGVFSEGDQVSLNINGNDYQGTVDAQGQFSIDVLGADLRADSDQTLEGTLVTVDADGNQQTQSFTQDLGDLLADSTQTAADDSAAGAAAPADQADAAPEAVGDVAADPMAPYLDLVGITGGNGGDGATQSEGAAAYLESVGVTPETAQNGASSDATVDDDAAAVADADPFEAAPETADADPMDAIQGAPDDITLVEPLPVAEVDIDQQHHG